MIKRHSRNSLHLLIDSEQRKKNQQFCDNDTSDDTDGEDNDDDDVFSDGSRQLRRHLRSCCGDRDSAMGSPVRFKDVAFYEEPGILMIVQSIGAEQQGTRVSIRKRVVDPCMNNTYTHAHECTRGCAGNRTKNSLKSLLLLVLTRVSVLYSCL